MKEHNEEIRVRQGNALIPGVESFSEGFNITLEAPEEAECGICTAIEDPLELAQGIRRMMNGFDETLGKKARLYLNLAFFSEKIKIF